MSQKDREDVGQRPKVERSDHIKGAVFVVILLLLAGLLFGMTSNTSYMPF